MNECGYQEDPIIGFRSPKDPPGRFPRGEGFGRELLG